MAEHTHRTTWRDPETGWVHRVLATNLHYHGGELLGALETSCGMRPPRVDMKGDGPVTCAWCRDGDWLREVTERLETRLGEEVPA